MQAYDKHQKLLRYKKKLESLARISKKDFDQLCSIMHERDLKKGEVILKEGQICKCYYYINNGSIRGFEIHEGKEININFYFEEDLACNFRSFIRQSPSSLNLVAAENCKVFYVSRSDAIELFLNNNSLHFLLFRFFEELYLKEEEHSSMFKLMSPAQRYKHTLDNHPNYFQQVPLTHLASYLGMSRETLNRIRKNFQ
ncbi:Crp/Fnr family transcriptional regulator [Danxiaibacter flavus]|uniref:Crp/Fnr family transcriptional regulator n=1 Tax=Danxiaibacter flavus TaxID=3049108 RepID=A0ABV3ZQ40_9BACT|nr:Crp/Fnr family transcriptional regulator [Chitinophagaceae bacterium DXS]